MEINTGSSPKTVFDAVGKQHEIAGTTFKVSVKAELDLFTVFIAKGSVVIGVENGVFSIDVAAKLSFFKIVDVNISGHFSIAPNGSVSFSFTGTLKLDLTADTDIGKFGIKGDLSVTVSDSGFSGHGSVSLVIFGENINIASGTVSVNWNTKVWLDSGLRDRLAYGLK